MANYNRVILAGRLTADPEVRSFNNGGKAAKLRFVTNKRKKRADGQWGEVPMYVDLKAFNSEYGQKLADLAEQHLRKGSAILVEGQLDLEEWDDKNGGGKRSKHVVIVDRIQFIGGKPDEQRQEIGRDSGGTVYSRPAQQQRSAPQRQPGDDEVVDEIPF